MVAVAARAARAAEPDHAADALAVAICHANHAPLAAAVAVADDRARRRRGGRPPPRPRRARDRGRRRLPPRRLGRDAAPRARRRHAPSRCTPTSSCATTRSTLYGFATEEERDLFLMLIGVQSVGPKMALAVLSGGPPRELVSRAGRRRRRPAAGRAGHRQAHGRADRRRAAREGRRRARRAGGPRSPSRAATTRAAWPATACSSSASRPPRRRAARRGRERRHAPRSCSPAPCGGRGHEPRAHLRRVRARAHARAGGRRRRARPLAAAHGARRVRRPGPPARAARRVDRGRGGARRGARPRAARRPARAGQDVAGADPRRRARRARSCRPPGPALERKGDVAALLTALEPRCGLLRRRDPPPEPRAGGDVLSRRWRTGACRSPSARARGRRVVTLDLPPFTLVGATTRAGLLTYAAARPLRHPAPLRALRDRGPRRASSAAAPRSSASSLDDGGAWAIAARSRGTPRVANRLLKRVRDWAEVRGTGVVDDAAADAALALLEVDELGLDRLDREILADDLREVRRRPGRPLDARGRRQRGEPTRSRTSTSPTCSRRA